MTNVVTLRADTPVVEVRRNRSPYRIVVGGGGASSTGFTELVKTDDYTQLKTDRGYVITFNKGTSVTYTLLAAATAGAGYHVMVKNIGAGTLTVDPDSSELINGAATLSVPTGADAEIWCTGTAWRASISFDPSNVAITGGSIEAASVSLPDSLILNAAMSPNLLGDAGRFSASTAMNGISSAMPGYMSAYNSSTITFPFKFIYNNDNYGGGAGVLDPIVDALVLKTKAAPLAKRYGPEFFIMKVVAGGGTAGSTVIGGETFYTQTISTQKALHAYYGVEWWVYVETGKAFWSGFTISTDEEIIGFYKNGVKISPPANTDAVVIPADGWVSLGAMMKLGSQGYNNYPFGFRATPGSTFYCACPKYYAGLVRNGDVAIVPNTTPYA